MAIYVPEARRRTRKFLEWGAFLIVGLVAGFLVAKAIAPSIADQVSAVQEQGRTVAANLRVIALHDEAKGQAVGGSGASTVDFTLKRAETGLKEAFAKAPWISPAIKTEVTKQVTDLQKAAGQSGFGPKADAAATAIERAFGTGSAP